VKLLPENWRDLLALVGPSWETCPLHLQQTQVPFSEEDIHICKASMLNIRKSGKPFFYK